MLSKGTRYLLAAVQAIVGYEWLVSGSNKLLSGSFPQGLGGALGDGLKDNPNGWYVSFMHAVVVPHSVVFGYLIQYCELLAGVALLVGALALIGRMPARGERQYRLALVEIGLAALAALGCFILCVNLHFYMGDGLISAVNTAKAFDEGIDLDTLLPPLSLLIAALNTRVFIALIGDEAVKAWFARLLHRPRHLVHPAAHAH